MEQEQEQELVQVASQLLTSHTGTIFASHHQQQPATTSMSNEQERLEALSEKLSTHVQGYPIKLIFPANIFGVKQPSETEDQSNTKYQDNNVPLRTSTDFINFRLMDTDIDFVAGEATSLSTVTESLQHFVADLQKTGCYDSVQVVLGRPKDQPSKSDARQMDVLLQEKNWYKLYIGGGIKQDNTSAISSSGMIPKVQFESSASLINLSGQTDITQLNYTLDQTSTPSISFQHTRPLYTLLKGGLSDSVLNMDQGSKVGVTLSATVDTVDYEHIRSTKDHLQKIGAKISNNTSGSSSSGHGPGNDSVYTGLEWSLAHRDVVPRRHTTAPFQCNASPEIIAASGPNLKHSVVADFRLNGYLTDDRFNPTAGVDAYGGVEVSGPPGDVGFVKLWGGTSVHVPIVPELDEKEKKSVGFLGQLLNGLSFHTTLNGGAMKGLSFGGLCSGGATTNISDRFYVGGSHQLRGFLPSGIGPRAATGGASTPGGDSIGGEVFYTASASLSMPFPGNDFLSKNGVRLFGFANAGTLTSFDDAMNVGAFINSTRTAVGGGVSVGTAMGRLEATYSVPLRYGPTDARRGVQAGIGFTFG